MPAASCTSAGAHSGGTNTCPAAHRLGLSSSRVITGHAIRIPCADPASSTSGRHARGDGSGRAPEARSPAAPRGASPRGGGLACAGCNVRGPGAARRAGPAAGPARARAWWNAGKGKRQPRSVSNRPSAGGRKAALCASSARCAGGPRCVTSARPARRAPNPECTPCPARRPRASGAACLRRRGRRGRAGARRRLLVNTRAA
jgi:hypothetical protein